MPAQLIDDATAWLRAKGSPLTAKNLNAAQAYLAENPDQRPSYAEQYADGTYQRDFEAGSAPLMDDMLDKVMAESAPVNAPRARSAPSAASTDNTPTAPAVDEPANDDTSGTLPSADNVTSEDNPLVSEPRLAQPAGLDTRTSTNARSVRETPEHPLSTTSLKSSLANLLGVDENGPKKNEERSAQPSSSDPVGTATAVGAGVGAAASLAAQLKTALDTGKNDQWVRDGFAKNIGKRVANAARGSIEGGGQLPKGVRPELQQYQIDALDKAMEAIRKGDMKNADRLLTYLSPEDQTALRGVLAAPPYPTTHPPTGIQKAMTSPTATSLIDVMKKVFTRGR